MIGSKDELIRLMWEDWKEKREESFIFSRFRDRKYSEASEFADSGGDPRTVKDHYICLMGARLLYEQGKLSEDCVLDIFKRITARNCKILSKYENIKSVEDVRTDFDLCLSGILKGLITDFFRNEGYTRENFKDADGTIIKTDLKREKRRTYNDYVELAADFSDYQKYFGDDKRASNSPNTCNADIFGKLNDEEYLKKCSKLYQSLKSGKNACSAYIPLYLDPESGAGIYLLGSQHIAIPSTDLLPCIMYFEGSTEEAERELYYDESIYGPDKGERSNIDFLQPVMTIKKYSTITNAVSAFKKLLHDRNSLLMGYKQLHYLPTGEDIAPDFRMYFDDPAEATISDDELVQARAYINKEQKALEKMKNMPLNRKSARHEY